MLKGNLVKKVLIKKVITKQNMSLCDEAIIGLRAINPAVEECKGVNKVPITLDFQKFLTIHTGCTWSTQYREMQRKGGKKLKNQNKNHTKGNLMK